MSTSTTYRTCPRSGLQFEHQAEWLMKANAFVAVVAMLYSVYALWASGKDAVMGGMLVMGIGYIVYGFIAPRFVAPAPEAARAA